MSDRLPLLLIETREINGKVHVMKVQKFFESDAGSKIEVHPR